MWKALVVACTTWPGAALADWVPVAPMPVPAQEIYGDTHDGLFYTLGGFDDRGRPTDAARAYDPVADAWRDLPPLSAPRHHVGVSVVGDTLFALGCGRLFEGSP